MGQISYRKEGGKEGRREGREVGRLVSTDGFHAKSVTIGEAYLKYFDHVSCH